MQATWQSGKTWSSPKTGRFLVRHCQISANPRYHPDQKSPLAPRLNQKDHRYEPDYDEDYGFNHFDI
jgi:hypothetical protein